jgi:hypothetical protein
MRKMQGIPAPTSVLQIFGSRHTNRTDGKSGGFVIYCEDASCLCYHCVVAEGCYWRPRACLDYTCNPLKTCRDYIGPSCQIKGGLWRRWRRWRR